MRCKMLAVGLVLVLGLALVGCPHPAPCGGKPANLIQDTSMTNVNPANIFYTEIPNWNTNPQLDPDSANVMSHFVECVAATGNRQPFWDAVWSIPMFYGDASVPKVNIRLWESYAVGQWFMQQRVPCWAEVNDGNTDSTIHYKDLVDGACEGSIWQYNLDPYNLNTFPCGATGGSWPTDLDGTGRAQAGLTGVQRTQAAGFGMGVFPNELTNINNPINHGTAFAYMWAHNKPTAYQPAYKADGAGTCTYDMCEGFRIQLNPSYTYGSERKTWERKYMDSLKKYGAYDCDSGGYLSWGGMPSKLSCTNNPFAGIFPDEVSLETSAGWDARFPLDQFRLIQRGALVTAGSPAQETPCGTYTNYTGTPNPAPPAPTLSSISPSTAAAGTYVTLNGTNMTGTYRVYFGPDTNCSWNPTVLSSTQVRCLVPAGSGTVAVKVKTGGGFSGTQSFTYGSGGPVPTLSSINPNNGSTAGGTACTLTGTNFISGATVSFAGTAGTGVVVDSGTQIRCASPAKTAGTYSVTVTTSNGTSGGVNFTFNQPAPTLSAIAPTSGTTAGGTACTLTGTNFISGATVSYGGTAGTGVTVDSGTQIRCASPAKTAGTYSVTVTTSGGTSGGQNYTYTAGGTSYTATLNPEADSYVLSSEPNTNYGGTNIVTQKNAGLEFRGILRFNMTSGVSGTTITSAKLRLNYWQITTSGKTITVYGCATDSWVENTVTWANKPAMGSSIATFAPTTAGWYEINLTSYINTEFAGDKKATVYLADASSQNVNWQCYPKEDSTRKPQLVVISQ